VKTPALIALPIAAVAAVLFVLGAGAASPKASWAGVVVAKDPVRKAIVTASAQGTVRTLRVTTLARFGVGQRLSVRAARLHDGTFRSHVTKISGRAARTKLRGTVIRHQAGLRRYLISAGGSVLAVRVAAARRTASVSARGPRTGDQVLMSVTLTGGTPTATTVQTVGHTQTLELEGIFLGLTTDGSIRLAVAERGEVLVGVPAGTQAPTAKPGDELEVDVTVDTAGGFTLAPQATEPADDDDESADTPSTDDDEDVDDNDDQSVDTPSVDDDDQPAGTPTVDDDDQSVDTPSVDDDDQGEDDDEEDDTSGGQGSSGHGSGHGDDGSDD
jgi:hypothetical protein